MSRRMQDETTIREVMYPEIDWQTYNWLKDFNVDTLTGDDKKRYDDFVMKYVRIGGFTMTENDKSGYPVPSRYEAYLKIPLFLQNIIIRMFPRRYHLHCSSL